MAKLVRHRHGAKRYTRKDIVPNGELACGASSPHDSPLWENFTIRMRETAEGVDSYTLELGRAECERIVRQLTEYLERDTRKPMMVNGSRGHA